MTAGVVVGKDSPLPCVVASALAWAVVPSSWGAGATPPRPLHLQAPPLSAFESVLMSSNFPQERCAQTHTIRLQALTATTTTRHARVEDSSDSTLPAQCRQLRRIMVHGSLVVSAWALAPSFRQERVPPPRLPLPPAPQSAASLGELNSMSNARLSSDPADELDGAECSRDNARLQGDTSSIDCTSAGQDAEILCFCSERILCARHTMLTSRLDLCIGGAGLGGGGLFSGAFFGGGWSSSSSGPSSFWKKSCRMATRKFAHPR